VESELLRIPGLSASLDEVWELDDFVAWLADELPDEPVSLLGHSFGGQIAIRFAALYPERVEQLILVDSSGVRDHRLLPTLKRQIFLIMAKIGKVFLNVGWARALLYKFARERDYKNAPPLLRRTMSNVLDAELHDDFSKIQAETLLIWGRDDTVTPLWIAELKHEQIPNSHLEIVDGARHSPQYTHVAEATKFVADFLSQ
jgi:pimeloyl-ACP methyl ester carboxylesterase